MFRFTTRDLLWLMVVVGMGAGWWLEHGASGRHAADNEALKTKLVELEDRLDLESPGRRLTETMLMNVASGKVRKPNAQSKLPGTKNAAEHC
jgi:hypothetical protein